MNKMQPILKTRKVILQGWNLNSLATLPVVNSFFTKNWELHSSNLPKSSPVSVEICKAQTKKTCYNH